MKILLVAINAKYIHSNLAVYCLKSYAAKRGIEVELTEYTINHRRDDILMDIYQRKPDVVAFSCYIWNLEFVQDIAADLYKVLPDLEIWGGGPEVSYDAKEVLRRLPCVKGVMKGEGEKTFKEICRIYRNEFEKKKENVDNSWKKSESVDNQLKGVDGISFREEKEKIIDNPWRPIMDLSEVPFVYDHMEDFEHKIIYYETSRGCPFSCSYCLSSVDKRLRFRDIELVKKELQFFLDQKVPQVKFIDRTFNCNHQHAMEIWKYIQEHDNGITNFHFEISADLLNGEELALLAKMRPGLVQLEIGVQSTNLQTLEAVRRHTNLDKLRHAVVRIHSEYNIHVHLDLIAGLPYEDMGSFIRSFNDVYSMRPQQLQLGFLKVLKGSYLEEMAQTYGIVYQNCPPYEVLYTKWLSYGDIIRLKRVEEMVELYYNSNQFTHLIPVLQSRFENPFAMYDKLADFYHEKGYFVHTPARAYRYQVLLEFAQQEDPDGMELYRELAVYDLYLRENAKSRPAFALDEKPYHDQIVEFYQEEEKNRTYLPGYEEYHARQLQRMTHLEVFSWPVQKKAWELISMLKRGEVPETKTAILFDYQIRDRLTDNARTAVVELPTAADAKPTAGQATAADAEAVAATEKGAAD